MISDDYAWLIWSSAFLIPWAVLFVAFPRYRKVMWWASLFTAPFGLTEPLFVPEYWDPPSLFDLAQRTGFDIESLIFCFAIGGVGAVLYNVLTGRHDVPVSHEEKHDARHRYHRWILLSPFLAFPVLYLFPWNAIYPGIFSMVLGAIATAWCRPDLKRATLWGGLIFLIYYGLFLAGLEVTAPGYIERVWNLDVLSGWTVLGFPLEELLFATAFGMYWSGVYEHWTWKKTQRVHAGV